MNQTQQLNFEVYLYQYSESPFASIGVQKSNESPSDKDKQPDSGAIKDQEDLRIPTANFVDIYENPKKHTTLVGKEQVPYTAIVDQLPVLQKNGAPEPLLTALKDNFIAQLEQQKDKFNWLNLDKTTFWKNFSEKIKADKTLLSKSIDAILDPANNAKLHVVQTLLTDDTTDTTTGVSKNCVLTVDDFRTHVESIDNGIVLTLDAKKLEQIGKSIVENDVIELVIDYPNSDAPTSVFYGFVINVTSVERYGEIIEYKVTCAGLGKYLHLSRVLKDTAIVTQFEQGTEIDKIELTPFENLFNNKNILEIFDHIMTNALHLTSAYATFSKHAVMYPDLVDSISILDSLISDLTELAKSGVRGLKYPPYLKTQEAAVKNARARNVEIQIVNAKNESTVMALADYLDTTYNTILKNSDTSDTNDIRTYIATITTERNSVVKTKDGVDAEKVKLPTGTIPYQLIYDFKSPVEGKPEAERFKSFQFAIFLLLLYYKSRKMSKYKDDAVTNTFAIFQTAAESQYKAFNVMIRQGWERFYSQVVTPIELLNTIRDKSFYEVFEDRPGIITCRPPRYNAWLGTNNTDYVIKQDKILEFNKIRNDSQLITRSDYKFTFPYLGVQEFIGGHWTDYSVLYKYGMRAEGPKDNPNVLTQMYGHFLAALDLIRSNAMTRRVTTIVPADKEYKVGTLYFLENKGISQEQIDSTPAGITRGIVGYVTSINTNITAGQLSTHTLELSYIRQAELINDTGKLNFYRIPDLETFMQYIEKMKIVDKTDPNSKTPKNMQQIDDEDKHTFKDWTNEPALLFNDTFYAVSPEVQPRVKRLLADISRADKNGTYMDLEESLISEGLLQYVAATSFTREQFASKANPTGVPFVSQELINRLWAVDMCIRKDPTTGGLTVDKPLVVLLDPTTDAFDKGRRNKESYTVKKGTFTVESQANEFIGAGIDCHNTEYGDYLNLGGNVIISDLRRFLDFYILTPSHDDAGTAIPKTFNFPGGLTAFATLLTSPPQPADKPYRWYLDRAGYPPSIFAGIASIPELYKFQFATLAQLNGFVGHKDMSEVTEKVKDAHRYGLEVDIMPAVLQYWKLSELKTVLTLGNGNVRGTTDDPFKYLSSNDLETYVHVPLDLTKILGYVDGWLSKFYFKPRRQAIRDSDKSKVGEKYTTMLSSSSSDVAHYKDYTYTLGTVDPDTNEIIPEYTDTHHIVVDHDFRKDTGIPFLKKALNFKINWYSNTDGVEGKPPTKTDEFYKLLQDKGGDSFKTAVASAFGLVGFGGTALGIEAAIGGATILGVPVVGQILGIAAIVGVGSYFLTRVVYAGYKSATSRVGKEFKTPYSNVEFYFRDLNTK